MNAKTSFEFLCPLFSLFLMPGPECLRQFVQLHFPGARETVSTYFCHSICSRNARKPSIHPRPRICRGCCPVAVLADDFREQPKQYDNRIRLIMLYGRHNHHVVAITDSWPLNSLRFLFLLLLTQNIRMAPLQNDQL